MSTRRGIMKIIVALLGAILITGSYGVPTEEQVQSAITRASEINALKRGLDIMETRGMASETPKCPLARFHGRREFTQVEQEQNAVNVLDATRILMNEGFSTQDLQHESVRSVLTRQLACPAAPTCDFDSNIRTIDGSCNNRQNPTWGMAGQPQLRRNPTVAYADQISTPRSTGVDGNTLPNPRLISNKVHAYDDANAEQATSQELTLHVFQFGQFLDHDLIATPLTDVADCCTDNPDPNKCMPIRVTWADDVKFPNNYCMSVPRSAASACGTSTSDAATVRQQVNSITSFIDASNVYGSSEAELTALRDTTDTAQLKMVNPGRRLPVNPDNSACASNPAQGVFCSLAGDHRVDVVPSLSAYHTLFVREHNRIAGQLRARIPDAEARFQTVRRIIIGIMQKITYDEYLPSFMSQNAMTNYGLSSTATYTYNPQLDPTVSNDFGIAYRFGHTWIPRKMSVFQRNFRPVREEDTETTYNDPTLTYHQNPPGLDGLAWWLTAENSAETDRVVEEAARSLLFQSGSTAFDLVALNIQRARDHGLPSYNNFRVWCNLPSADTWGGLIHHTPEARTRLRGVYSSPQDIDLFTGLVTERPVRGGHMGPTLECILGDQFQRLKYGDRFWYQGDAAGLSAAEQQAIRAYSMAKIQCDNFNFANIDSPNVFLKGNNRANCGTIPALDLTQFNSIVPTTGQPVPPPGPRPGPRPGPGGTRPRPRSQSINELVGELIKELEDLEN